MEEHSEYLTPSPVEGVTETVSDAIKSYNKEIWAGIILVVVFFLFIYPKLKGKSQSSTYQPAVRESGMLQWCLVGN